MKNVFKIFGIVYLILCQFQDVTSVALLDLRNKNLP